MSNIDKQDTREKFEAWAEGVGALPWGTLKKYRNQDGSYPGTHYTYMWNAWNASHEALLDELEAKDRRNAELNSTMERWAVDRAQSASELDEAEKQIAELEAREVTLPPTFWYEHDDLSRDVPVMDARKVKKSIRDAGIRIAAAAGKGE